MILSSAVQLPAALSKYILSDIDGNIATAASVTGPIMKHGIKKLRLIQWRTMSVKEIDIDSFAVDQSKSFAVVRNTYRKCSMFLPGPRRISGVPVLKIFGGFFDILGDDIRSIITGLLKGILF